LVLRITRKRNQFIGLNFQIKLLKQKIQEMSYTSLQEMSQPLHAQKDFLSNRMADATGHSPALSHPLPQMSKNRRNGTTIVLPLQAHLKRTWKHDSLPASSIKKLRLVVKAGSDQRGSSIKDNKRRPIKIRMSLLDSIKLDENVYSFTKTGTKETAHLMVKWALQNTPYLVANFEITASKS
jgi:hypothetical protein